jgi:hypothetical protein
MKGCRVQVLDYRHWRFAAQREKSIRTARSFQLVTLYEYTRQPRYWVAHDEEGYWLVPAQHGGWEERVPFVGHAVNLRPVLDLEGIDLGIPVDGSG